MGLERDLAEARLRVGQLEAREANWVARHAQWVNILTDRLHVIVGLQEQREQQREEVEQQRETCCRRWFGARVRCTVFKLFAALLPPR
jgi:hypothetical protein